MFNDQRLLEVDHLSETSAHIEQECGRVVSESSKFKTVLDVLLICDLQFKLEEQMTFVFTRLSY